MRVPAAGPVKQVEGVLGRRGVAGVERADPVHGGGEDRLVAVTGLGGGVGEVAQHREVEVGLAVGQELDFEILQRLVHRVHAAEQRRDHHRGAELGRHAVLVEVELGERAGREERGHELVDHVDRNVGRRYQAEEQHREPLGARGRAAEPEHRGQRGGRGREHAADEYGVRVAVHPALDRLARGGTVAGRLLQLGQAGVHQVVADVRAPGIVRGGGQRGASAVHRQPRHRLFAPPGPPGHPLDRVAVAIAGGEVHARVEARRVLPQNRLHPALALDERLPVHPRDRAEAGDAVRHADLGEGEPLGGLAGGLLRAQCLVRDPLLQPHDGGQRAAFHPELLEETGDERRGERRRRFGKALELGVTRLGPRLARAGDPGRRLVGRLQIVEPLHGAQRHPAHVLDQAQPEHRGHRPELADGEPRHLLERLDERADVVEADPALAVGDERDRQLVDPRVARQRAGGQHRQLAVVAAGEALLHLTDVLLHHVIVVQQPLAGGADVGAAIGGGGELGVRVIQGAAGVVEPGEERRAPPVRRHLREPLPRGHVLGPLGQVLGAEQLAADRAGQQIVADVGARSESAGEGAANVQRIDGEGLGSRVGTGAPGVVRSWGRDAGGVE